MVKDFSEDSGEMQVTNCFKQLEDWGERDGVSLAREISRAEESEDLEKKGLSRSTEATEP
jgi:hypothetical protein